MSRSPGEVILSFDFEIGWGNVTNGGWRALEREGVYRRLRVTLPDLLSHMDDCGVPATWATVGGMIDDPERRTLDHLPEKAGGIVREALAEAAPESFDGRDLFRHVIDARAGHRIACHSYSHVPFTYAGVNGRFVRRELHEFHRVLDGYGLSTDRFVFPENREAFWSDLAAGGVGVARVGPDRLFRSRWLYLASIAIVPPPAGRNEVGEEGVMRQYGSMLFNHARQNWRLPLIRRRLDLGLRHVVHRGDTLHLWSHPFDFAESGKLLAEFKRFLSELAEQRERGLLRIGTM